MGQLSGLPRLPYRVGQVLGIDGGVCVVVTRAAGPAEALTSDGQPLVTVRPPACSAVQRGSDGEVRASDILCDPVVGLEVRCIRGGSGPLVHAGRTMVRRTPRVAPGAG